MRIVEEPEVVYEREVLSINSAMYDGNFVVVIRFSNGIEKSVDFRSFLENSGHPEIRKYLDENLFKSFQIVDGNLNWNDFDLIFPLADLLEGKVG